jgi:hypothetical protein
MWAATPSFIGVASLTLGYISQKYNLLLLHPPMRSSRGIEIQKCMRFKICWIPKRLREGIPVSGSKELIIINSAWLFARAVKISSSNIDSIRFFGLAKIQHREGVKCSRHRLISIIRTHRPIDMPKTVSSDQLCLITLFYVIYSNNIG